MQPHTASRQRRGLLKGFVPLADWFTHIGTVLWPIPKNPTTQTIIRSASELQFRRRIIESAHFGVSWYQPLLRPDMR